MSIEDIELDLRDDRGPEMLGMVLIALYGYGMGALTVWFFWWLFG